MLTAPVHESTDRRSTTVTIALAVLGVFVTYVPITGVSVSLTTIGQATGASTADLQWISDSYVIPMAAAVLSAGVFGDLHGRRRVYLIGMALTVLGAVVAGLAALAQGFTAVHVLWAGQAVSGLGAGLLLPTTLALIAHAVPDFRARGRYVGMWATGMVAGLAVGPLISGGILEFTGWGWVFAPIVVLALAAGVVALRRLPESEAPAGRHLDWAGQITATIAIAASIYGVIEGGENGWSSAQSVLGLTVGALALLAFIVAELRSSSPLMDLGLFRSPAFSAAGFAAVVALFSVVGTMFLLSLFLGYVQQLSPLGIGVRLLFVTGVTVVVNQVLGRVAGSVRPILLLSAGLLLSAVGVLLLTGVDEGTGFADLVWRLAVFGVSMSLMLAPLSVVAINSVPWQLAGMAAAGNTALRQYGGALGPAVLGVVFAGRLDAGASQSAALHTALLVNVALLLLAAMGCLLAARSRPAAPTSA